MPHSFCLANQTVSADDRLSSIIGACSGERWRHDQPPEPGLYRPNLTRYSTEFIKPLIMSLSTPPVLLHLVKSALMQSLARVSRSPLAFYNPSCMTKRL